jgi:hypothetical protein
MISVGVKRARRKVLDGRESAFYGPVRSFAGWSFGFGAGYLAVEFPCSTRAARRDGIPWMPIRTDADG